jgi:hypothetical protein
VPAGSLSTLSHPPSLGPEGNSREFILLLNATVIANQFLEIADGLIQLSQPRAEYIDNLPPAENLGTFEV